MRWKTAAVLLVAACLVIDFVPNSGTPNFRYTGSDPAMHVWNFGFPLATAIYDPRIGWQVGPGILLLFPVQAVVLIVVGTIAVVGDSRSRRLRACSASGHR